MNRPLAIDLYCGLGGWAEGFLAEGYDVIGFDIERHDYGTGGYPGQLVLQDALTLHGSQFREAAAIVASPPCTEYSYMAMPWKRAKQIARALRGRDEFPTGYLRSRTVEELNALFDACFRIQREASEAAGEQIPMVVENVKGAQPWVGRSAWNFGSFYLWGDVPALMPFTYRAQKKTPDGTNHPQGSWFAIADSKNRGAGRKVAMNFHEHEKTGKPGRSFQSVAVEGVKSAQDGLGGYGGNFGWNNTPMRRGNSKSASRKSASAQIAKIPIALAQHIAQVFKPVARTDRKPMSAAPTEFLNDSGRMDQPKNG